MYLRYTHFLTKTESSCILSVKSLRITFSVILKLNVHFSVRLNVHFFVLLTCAIVV